MQETKKSYHHGSLKKSLLAAGDSVLAENGFKGFTLRECARRAGVSHAAPKHHFGDITGFLTELAAIGFDRLTAQLQSSIPKAKNLDDEFIATVLTYSNFAQEYPEHFRIMFRGDLLHEESERLKLAARETLTELTNVIMRQRDDAEITLDELPDIPKFEDVVADIVIGWCYIHGYAHLMLENKFPVMRKNVEKRIIKASSSRLARLIQKGAAAKGT
jgi:AcrR family transcriptional regulator